MNCVSLICTVHDEVGLANVSELRAVLERVRPEVIFLEVPLAALDDYYVICSRSNLESLAVRTYRENRPVKLVPVDLPTPEAEFFEKVDYLHRRIRAESPEYRQLMARDTACMRAHGFAYLNSEDCSSLWSDAYMEMLSTIRRLDDATLMEIFDSWKETIDHRENEMMKNVQEYCRANTFDVGVFLVGAAHRQPIIDKSREELSIDSNMRWDFSAR